MGVCFCNGEGFVPRECCFALHEERVEGLQRAEVQGGRADVEDVLPADLREVGEALDRDIDGLWGGGLSWLLVLYVW